MSIIDKMKFWVTCPYCKQKFGVRTETVLKYMDRLFDQLQERTVRNMGNVVRRVNPEPPANLPVAED